MAESSMRKVGHIKKDLISDLPRNIQEHILGFLPIRDAVKTSTLSKKWRHCWTMIPHLIFDYEFLDSMWDEDSDNHEQAHKFVSVIDKVLLLHNGPIIKFFIICPDSHNDRIILDYIAKWITLLSKNGIKQLTLHAGYIRLHDISSLDLTHLRLIQVWFPYTPVSGGFSYMTSLELVNVTVDKSEQSIFYCPVLEKLTLITCELFPANFCAPKLKCLYQRYSKFILENSVAGFENLTEYSYYLEDDPKTRTQTSNVVKVVGTLHKIEKFTAGLCFIKYLAAGGSPNRLSKPLPYLKTLDISDINLTDLSEVSCLLCLLRSAPNLCKLHINLSWVNYGEKDFKNYWIEEVSEDCTLDHLEIVTFSFFKGHTAEMELVKFLLSHSPLLKTMFIHRSNGIQWAAALTMAEKMVEYSRASSRAQIKYLKRPVVYDEYLELWDYIL